MVWRLAVVRRETTTRNLRVQKGSRFPKGGPLGKRDPEFGKIMGQAFRNNCLAESLPPVSYSESLWISCMCITEVVGSAPLIMSSAMLAAMCPSSRRGWRTVVSAGTQRAAIS